MFRSGEIYHLKTFLEANVYVPQHSLPLTEVDVAWFWMLWVFAVLNIVLLLMKMYMHLVQSGASDTKHAVWAGCVCAVEGGGRGARIIIYSM